MKFRSIKQNITKKEQSLSTGFHIRNYTNYTWFIIITSVVLFTTIGAYYAFEYTPKYQATALLENKIYGSVNVLANNANNHQVMYKSNVAREVDLIKTDDVFSLAVSKLLKNAQLYPLLSKYDKRELFNMIKDKTSITIPTAELRAHGSDVTNISDLIRISYSDLNPNLAASVVNAVTQAAVDSSKLRKQKQLNEAITLLNTQKKPSRKPFTEVNNRKSFIKSDRFTSRFTYRK